MKITATRVLVILAIIVIVSFPTAQQPPGNSAKRADPTQPPKVWSAAYPIFCWEPAGIWAWYKQKMPGPDYACAGPYGRRPEAGPITGAEVTSVDLKNKTFTVSIIGSDRRPLAMRFAGSKLKKLPAIGAIVDLMEDPKRFIFASCEECNSVCPGVCFLGPDNCRCYLFHLRTAPKGPSKSN